MLLKWKMSNGMEASLVITLSLEIKLSKLHVRYMTLPVFFHLSKDKVFPQGPCSPIFKVSHLLNHRYVYCLIFYLFHLLFCPQIWKWSNWMFIMFISEISETSESLKTKMSELRLYCDLLMQQVHTIQEFVHHDENHSSPSIEV